VSEFRVQGTISREPRLARTSEGVAVWGFHLVEDGADAPASNPLRLDVIASGALASACAERFERGSRVEVRGALGRREMRRGKLSYPVFTAIAAAVRPLGSRREEPPMARVVHCMQDPYDTYIGRGSDPHTGRSGEWGNPYSHRPSRVPGVIVAGSAAEAVDLHKRWLWGEIRAGRIGLEKLAALHGQTLGCWCSGICHGTTLAAAAAWAHRRLAAA
jgi:primosomal replication protein N